MTRADARRGQRRLSWRGGPHHARANGAAIDGDAWLDMDHGVFTCLFLVGLFVFLVTVRDVTVCRLALPLRWRVPQTLWLWRCGHVPIISVTLPACR